MGVVLCFCGTCGIVFGTDSRVFTTEDYVRFLEAGDLD